MEIKFLSFFSRHNNNTSIVFSEPTKNSKHFDIFQNAVNASTKVYTETKKNKGRTGWPQHVWASELKSD